MQLPAHCTSPCRSSAPLLFLFLFSPGNLPTCCSNTRHLILFLWQLCQSMLNVCFASPCRSLLHLRYQSKQQSSVPVLLLLLLLWQLLPLLDSSWGGPCYSPHLSTKN
jgi:hypothetical protein